MENRFYYEKKHINANVFSYLHIFGPKFSTKMNKKLKMFLIYLSPFYLSEKKAQAFLFTLLSKLK